MSPGPIVQALLLVRITLPWGTSTSSWPDQSVIMDHECMNLYDTFVVS